MNTALIKRAKKKKALIAVGSLLSLSQAMQPVFETLK
jgi:hypothetical protein